MTLWLQSSWGAYVRLIARWPAVVRTLVLLGSPPDEAEVDAREGLTRCLPGWDRARREGDVDVWVYRTVLEARGRASGADPPDGAAVVDPTIVDLEDRLELLSALVAALAAGRRVLNCFAYTGGFSVGAARLGAAHVTSIDTSQPSLELAHEAFALNGLDPEAHDFLVGDERSSLYAGRLLEHRGETFFFAWQNEDEDGRFLGRLSDPMPVRREGDALHVDATAGRG